MPKVTVELDGESKEIEVAADAVQYSEDETPTGFVAQDTVDDVIKSRLQRQEKSLKDQLKTDDTFFRQAAQQRGIELREDGQPKGALKDEEIQNLRQIKAKYDGLKEEVPTLKSELNSLRDTSLESQLLKEAGDVKDDLQDAFIEIAKSRFKYDPELKQHVLTDDEGDIRYETGSAAPATAKTFVEEMRESKPSFFKPTKMNGGPSTRPGGKASSGKVMTKAEWEKATSQPEKYTDEEWQEILNAEIKG